MAIFLAVGAAVWPTFADVPAPVRAEIVKQTGQTDYRYFNAPTALYADQDAVYVAEQGTFVRFSIADKQVSVLPVTTDRPVEKMAITDGWLLALGGGTIQIYNLTDNTQTTVTGSTFVDFGISPDGTVFAAEQDGIVQIDPTSGATTAVTLPTATQYAKPRKIAADIGRLYVAYASPNNPYEDDILCYTYAGDAFSGVYDRVTTGIRSIKQTLALAPLPAAEGLVALHSGGLTRYDTHGDYHLKEGVSYQSDAVRYFAVHATDVYLLTSKKSIVSLTTQLDKQQVFLASAASEVGFFDAPAGLTTRKGNIYVADENNNRVQILTPDRTLTLTTGLSRPKAVAVDYVGNIYVAHSISEISVFNPSLSFVRTLHAPDENILLTQLKINSSGTLFALSDEGQLYSISAGTFNFTNARETADVKAIEIGQQSDRLYFVTNDNRLLYLDENGNETACVFLASSKTSQDFNIRDLCADNDDAIYLLTASGDIAKFRPTEQGSSVFSLAYDTPTAYEEGYAVSTNASHIVMNTAVQSAFAPMLEYGDLLVTDTGAHALKAIDGSAFAVNEHFAIGGTPEIPDAENPTPAQPDNRIIYRLQETCEVYGQEAEIAAIATLAEGMYVIVPDFDASKKFNFVIADNLKEGNKANPIVGYVYTSLLQTPAREYTSEHAEFCYTWMPNVPIYKYPARNAPVLKDYKELQQNSPLKLLDFVFSVDSAEKITYGFTDNYVTESITWYRVAFGPDFAYEGFVVSDYISTRSINPSPIQYPRTNAYIVASKDNPDGAPVYQRNEDGTFTRMDEPLLALGTKAEVVGTFDSSERYTKIRFLVQDGNAKHVVERWVETANLKYTGINIVQIVAILIIVITLLLVGLVIWRVVYTKRNRRPSELKL